MQLSNRLFFEQVEAMLAEGHEVQIRMKGHSMRPLLRSERDIAVLTPIARYTGGSEAAAAARKQNRLARNETSPDTAAKSFAVLSSRLHAAPWMRRRFFFGFSSRFFSTFSETICPGSSCFPAISSF